MKMLGSGFYLAGYHDRDHVLLYAILIVACANLVISEVNEALQERVTSVRSNTGKRMNVVQETKVQEDRSTESLRQQSEKITDGSDSPALRSFLKNVLKARDELKWIDRAGSRINYRNSPYGRVHDRKTVVELGPLSDDRLNSNKNLQYERDNRENRRIRRDYGLPQKLSYVEERKKLSAASKSLEKLKETLLELKENLTRKIDDSKDVKFWIGSKKNRKLPEEGSIKNKNSAKEKKNLVKQKKRSVYEKTPNLNDYWRSTNEKELSKMDDSLTSERKLYNYKNNPNFSARIKKKENFRSKQRRLLSMKCQRPLIYNENNCFAPNNLFKRRKLLENEKNDKDDSAEDSLGRKCDGVEMKETKDDSSDPSEKLLQKCDNFEKSEGNHLENGKVPEKKRQTKLELNGRKNRYEARVNVLIKERIAAKHREDNDHIRRKRYPLGIIEYYDYDEEFENDVRDNRAEEDSSNANANANIDKISRNLRNCTLLKKKNEQAEEEEKENKRKGKMENKELKQQFIVELGQAHTKNETDKNGNPSKSSRSKVTFKEDDEHEKIDRDKLFLKGNDKFIKDEWLDGNKVQREYGRQMEERNIENLTAEIIQPRESIEYIFQGPETIEQEDIVDVIFSDVEPIDLHDYTKQLNGLKDTKITGSQSFPKRSEPKQYDDIGTVYDELKRIYDWEDNENKNGPRLKGDQRLYQDTKNDLDKEGNVTSATDYFALKKTDDLFKGGIEQGIGFDERTLPNSSMSSNNSTTNSEPKIIPVVETINDSRPKSSGVLLRSLESGVRRNEHEIDSGSPYENGRYLELLKRNGNDNERFAIESNDMHESFVEPINGFDDFDDVRVRLGRSLKTIEERYQLAEPLKIITTKDKKRIDPVENLSTSSTDKNGNEIRRCEEGGGNTTTNGNFSSLLRNDNRKDTRRTSEFRVNDTHSGVNEINAINEINEINEIVSSNHSLPLPSIENKNASRVKREGNSYSLTSYMEENPEDVYYERWKDIANDVNTVDPYEDLVNPNYRDLADQSSYDPIHFASDYYGKRRGNSSGMRSKNGRRRRRRRRRRKKRKRKKEKKKKEKRKKNTSLKEYKKRSTSSYKTINGGYKEKDRRKRKPRHSFHKFPNISSRKKRKRKIKWISNDRDRRLVKTNRGNSNESTVSRANVLREKDESRMKGFEVSTRRKKLALLLTADNMEDESQMDLALHGELPGKIVENIFEQVQKNEALKIALGPGLYRKYKLDESKDKTYFRDIDEDKIRYSEKTLEKIMELLDRLVLDEVQKKTCLTLSSDMRQFLEWIVDMNDDEMISPEQVPSLPLVHDQEITGHFEDDKILFPEGFNEEDGHGVDELLEKVRILKNLINEYNTLSTKEKIKIQTVHDYLLILKLTDDCRSLNFQQVRQLNLLLRYVETKEERAEKGRPNAYSLNVEAAKRNAGFILRYESAIPKDKTPSKWSNKTIGLEEESRSGNRRSIRSSRQLWQTGEEKRKKRKRRQEKRKESEENENFHETKEYRKLTRNAEAMRKKRADLLEDEWNPFDFKYEKPEVYKFMSILRDDISRGNEREKRSARVMQEREIIDTSNVTLTNLTANKIIPLPIKGKNRVEDEMILLNKREAWKNENERLLEEVAFGKDMRDKKREEERFKILTGINKNDMVDTKIREKREYDGVREKGYSNNSIDNFLNITILNIKVEDGNLPKKVKTNNVSSLGENELILLEQKINVYPDNSSDISN